MSWSANPFVQDVAIKWSCHGIQMLPGDGGKCSTLVWGAATELAEYLHEIYSEDGLGRPGVRVLELGAGTGWLGMVMAQNLPHLGRIVLTEMEDKGCYDHLARTVQHNKDLGVAGVARVETAPLDWSHVVSSSSMGESRVALLQERWDYVVGSDLIYGEQQACLLPQVMRAILESHRQNKFEPPTMFYCQTLHRWGYRGYDRAFHEHCLRNGLHLAPVWLQGYGKCSSTPTDGDRLAVEVGESVLALKQRPAVFAVQLEEHAVLTSMESMATSSAESKSAHLRELAKNAESWLTYSVRWQEDKDIKTRAHLGEDELESIRASDLFSQILDGD